MTEKIEQSTGEIHRVSVSIRGREVIMFLQRQGNNWILDGGGISGTASTPDGTFVTALGIFDGKKAAKRWEEDRSMEGGEEL